MPLGTALGVHALRVSVVGGTIKGETTLVVSAPTTVQPRTQVLSRTGGGFARTVGVAVVLCLAGFVIVGMAWRGGQSEPAFGRPLSSKRQWPRR